MKVRMDLGAALCNICIAYVQDNEATQQIQCAVLRNIIYELVVKIVYRGLVR